CLSAAGVTAVPGSQIPPGAGRFTVAQQVHFDRRRLVHSQDAIVVKVRLLNSPVAERHFTPQRGADAVYDTALDLRSHDVGVDDLAAVHSTHDPVYPYVSRAGDLDVADL